MSKVSKILEYKEIVFSATAISVAILNLWIATQLAPVTQGISNLETRVNATEKSIDGVEIKIDRVAEDVGYIRGVLSR